jgi:hypothetical protein
MSNVDKVLKRKTHTEEELEKAWVEDTKKVLLGKKIIGVGYLPKKFQKEWGWYNRPIVLRFDDNHFIYPSMDDEGNDGGALFTSYKELDVIPVFGGE